MQFSKERKVALLFLFLIQHDRCFANRLIIHGISRKIDSNQWLFQLRDQFLHLSLIDLILILSSLYFFSLHTLLYSKKRVKNTRYCVSALVQLVPHPEEYIKKRFKSFTYLFLFVCLYTISNVVEVVFKFRLSCMCINHDS